MGAHATQQAFLEAHEMAFRYFGGVFKQLRYDNLKSAVKRILRGHQREETSRFIAFRYRPGLLCIGDAAHAMSPAGGVGINLAIQDAVAAANLLTGPLQKRRVSKAVLARVQKRREFPTRVTQAIQLSAHRGLARVFENPGPIHAPWQMKAAVRIPGIQCAVGYAVGIGVRPEHVREQKPTRLRRNLMATAVFAAVGIAAATAVLSWAAWRTWNRISEVAS